MSGFYPKSKSTVRAVARRIVPECIAVNLNKIRNSGFIQFVGLLLVACMSIFLQLDSHVEWVAEFFEKHEWVMCVCSLVYIFPVIVNAMLSLVKYEPLPCDELEANTLLRHTDWIVAKKTERFQKNIRKASVLKPISECPHNNGSMHVSSTSKSVPMCPHSNKPCKTAIFLDITQPDRQIESIVDQIQSYFHETRTHYEDKICVSLAKMGDKHIESFVWVSPINETMYAPQDLKNPDSAFSQAKKLAKTIVIEDIQKESNKNKTRRIWWMPWRVIKKEKFFIDKKDIEGPGSFISHPLRHSPQDDVCYVIGVKSSAVGAFRKEKTGDYKYWLDHFGKRILLELNLKKLKEG